MESNHTRSHQSNKRLYVLLGGVAIALLSLLAVQLTIGSGIDGQGFNWQFNDFFIAGLLLLFTALSCEWVLRRAKSNKKRLLFLGFILLLLFLIWAELAVGIFGTPFAGS